MAKRTKIFQYFSILLACAANHKFVELIFKFSIPVVTSVYSYLICRLITPEGKKTGIHTRNDWIIKLEERGKDKPSVYLKNAK